MAYTPYGLTYGLALIGSQAMPQYYAAQSRALKSETDQMEAQALQQQIQQRDMTMARSKQEAEAKDKDAELKRHLDGVRTSLLRRDYSRASEYLGAPIEEDADGNYLVTDPNSGKKYKTLRGELHAALAGGDELARWSQNVFTQEEASRRQGEGATQKEEAAKVKHERDLEKLRVKHDYNTVLRELDNDGRIRRELVKARGQKGADKMTTQMRNYLALKQVFEERGDPDADEKALKTAFPGYTKPQTDKIKNLLGVANAKAKTYDFAGAGDAIREAIDAIEPAATTGNNRNQIVIKGKDGKPVKLTPMK